VNPANDEGAAEPEKPVTPAVEITEEEWIAAGQACWGADPEE
jgi:hypothetical protein